MSRYHWVVLAVFLLPASSLFAQAAAAGAPQAQSAQQEIYHVHFVQAAPGKSAELQNFVATPPADGPAHMLVLRHVQGSPWDFLVIQHIGPKATVEASGIGPARELRAWHEDTFAAGPSWETFSKAMGIDAKGKTADDAVYIVGTYRGAPGHRAQLQDTLGKIQAAGTKPDSGAILAHVEGGNWDYLTVSRYDSWQALATEETDPAAEQRAKRAGLTPSAGLALREHIAAHNDTIAVPVPLQSSR